MRANLFVYREVDDPWLREMRRRAGRDHECRAAQAAPDHRRIRRCRRRQDQACRSLCLNRPSPTRRRPGRRCLCAHLPGYRHRHRQGVPPTCPALRSVHIPPGLRPKAWARTRPLPSTTIRSSRPATPGRWQSRVTSASHDRRTAILARAALGAVFLTCVSAKAACGGCEVTGSARGQTTTLTPRRHPPHRRRLHCRHRPDRALCDARPWSSQSLR